jgi:Hemerythrin HHE cation binding domain
MKTSAEPFRSSATADPARETTAATPSPIATAAEAPAASPHAVHEQILAEHRALREVLVRVQTHSDLYDLLALLAELRALLVPHFATEEADEGFERLLGRRAPHLLAGLGEVLDEHGEILADVDRLTAAARACLDGPVAAVRRQAGALVARLHAHEEKETELLVGAVYDDLGTPS